MVQIHFGTFLLNTRQVFFESSLTYGIVNLKPIVPGHVLMISKRVVPRLADLNSDEVIDLFSSIHKITPILEKHYGATALNIAVQDGKHAGQSVPHIHVHILPRAKGDFKRNDDVYTELENQQLDKEYTKLTVDPDEARRPRTVEEMAKEALELRTLFPDNAPNFDEET